MCVVAWLPLLVSPRCLSVPFFTQKFIKNFLEFLRNFIFEDYSEIGISIKTQKNKDETISSKSKPSMQQL
jgi:hypothetical protein